MRKILKKLLSPLALWLSDTFSSSPNRHAVFYSLTNLLQKINADPARSQRIPITALDRIIIFSDQHKGNGDFADDFRSAVTNYSAALTHYFQQGYTFFNLGDCEELWENTESQAVEHNRSILQLEAQFAQENRYYRTFGNHDLAWKFSFPRNQFLKSIFGDRLEVCEAFVLDYSFDSIPCQILLTHGHQGDKRSDTNAFSAWFVAAIWTPIQRFLELSVNTVADSYELGDKHNKMMYDWAITQPNLLLITGHTHKPVFASLDHIERLEVAIEQATESGNGQRLQVLLNELEKRKLEYQGKQTSRIEVLPKYFNTGCCCFADGDITGIEIAEGEIRLIKWEQESEGATPIRKVLEWAPLDYVFAKTVSSVRQAS